MSGMIPEMLMDSILIWKFWLVFVSKKIKLEKVELESLKWAFLIN